MLLINGVCIFCKSIKPNLTKNILILKIKKKRNKKQIYCIVGIIGVDSACCIKVKIRFKSLYLMVRAVKYRIIQTYKLDLVLT